ncbi:MAG: type II toxin-antitoxin system RelE/ParE family toxin [Bacteroidales bacterium]|jgi:toxin ParE1/3/4|nr:type II toxin-antitoxin system RelE/ParE family toxin [Bacteroidales bacterium]
MPGYRFTNEALKDLEEVWSYTNQKWSLEQADRYYNLIIEEIEFIASNPLSGRSIDFIKEGYRSAKVKSHIVFYKQQEDNKILIVRILHQRMDCENRMK